MAAGRTDRQRLSLKEPPADVSELEVGPAFVLAGLVRCARRTFASPWFFSNDGQGRFDLGPPKGTCYLASDEVGAVREALGPGFEPGAVVAEAWFDARWSWSIDGTADGWTRGICDLLSDAWSHLGLTNEVFTVSRYEGPRRWATAFHAAAWDGLRVLLRHVLDHDRFGIALFGAEGAAASDPRFECRQSDIDAARFAAETGIAVLPSAAPVGSLHVIT